MNKVLDAKFFVLSPDEQNRAKIKNLIKKEICEIYILEKPELIKPIISRFKKSILVLSSHPEESSGNYTNFVLDLINSCAENLLKIIIIGDSGKKITHERILNLERNQLENNYEVMNIIDSLDIKGFRNYIRLGYKNSRIAFFRMNLNNEWRTGVIHDISAAGMSCSFDQHRDISPDENSRVIELSIKDRIFRLSGNFLIRRTFKNNNIFVIVFTRRNNMENIKSLKSIIYNLTREEVLDKIREIDR